MAIPARIQARIVDGLKRFQPIVEAAKIRDANESDTVVMLTGILSEILGYDRYTDITTEYAIRGTYCDLALKIDGNIAILLEAKAVGIELKDPHVKQAVDYGANKGIDWIILTNGVTWRIYKILFTKPIQHIPVLQFEFLQIRSKSIEDIELLYLISKEGILKNSMEEFYIQKQATNKFMVGNLLYSEPVLNSIRKELKNIYPDIKVTAEEIQKVLTNSIVKREIIEGEHPEEARKKIAKSLKKKEKAKTEKPLEQAVTAETPISDELPGIPLN
jgi:hypothetical protein